ncbi:ARHGB factor, partial [Climacteris rufus]|nr:ARHGB factor [Climacteris rufus]
PSPPFRAHSQPLELQDPEVQRHAAQILRNMLRQEEAELQRFCELYSRSPGAAVQEQMERARRRLSQLQLKILQESAGAADLGGDPGLSRPLEGEVFQRLGRIPAFPASSGSPALPGRFSLDSQDGDSGLESGPERFLSLGEGLGRPQIIGPEEDCDPGDSNNESDSVFQDLAKLKSRPAHLGVFLRFLFSQADPSALLFHLCADVCQQSNPRDSRVLGRDLWNIFLDRSAPLRVKVPEPLLAEIGECGTPGI